MYRLLYKITMALIIDVETIGLPDRDGLLYGEYHSFENLAMYD